jgi:starvation-inducible DNA-binding protein
MDTTSQAHREGRSSRGNRVNPFPQTKETQAFGTVEIQAFGTVEPVPNGLSDDVRKESVAMLNATLADVFTIRDMYKKHHWQVSGPTFYQLHLLFDKHHNEQVELVDLLAERIQALGGVSLAMSADIAEATHIPRVPKGREDVSTQISRLLEAHSILLQEVRKAARKASESGDDGTNDVLVSEVIRTNEQQVWFLAEHLKNVPLLSRDGRHSES